MRILAILLLLPTLAMAQIEPVNVLSVVTADWNGDGQKDRAILVHDPDEDVADLYIYLSKDGMMLEKSYSAGITWAGAKWGQQPSLGQNASGSLQVHSLNEGTGRTRWIQTLTIDYREGRFVMAGFTYDDYDTLDVENYGSCDVNLLTGQGFVSRGEVVARKINVQLDAYYASNWTADIFPQECF